MVIMSSVLEAMKGPIGVAFLTMVTVLLVSKDLVVLSVTHAGPATRNKWGHLYPTYQPPLYNSWK